MSRCGARSGRERSEGRPRGVPRKVRDAAQDPEAFAVSRERLEQAIEAACDSGQPWAVRVAAAIGAALTFADEDPVAAGVLTVHSAFRRLDSAPAFTAMVDDLAAQLRRQAPPTRHPQRTARTVILRIARQLLLQLELRPDSPATELAPELIVFALTPYVGLTEAQRCA